MNKYIHIVLFFNLFFVACSSKNYVDILQQENLTTEISFLSPEIGNMYFLKKIRIKNNSFRFVSLKIKYVEGGHPCRSNLGLRLERDGKYTFFEKNTIKLCPFQEREIYHEMSLDIDLEKEEEKSLIPLFEKNYDSTKYFKERQSIEIDYHKFKKEYPTVMEYLLQGYDTIEVKVLKPKEEILHFKNEW